MNKITINGLTISGNHIRVQGNEVFIDGSRLSGLEIVNQKLEIRILEGVLESLTADGSVYCGDITGPVSAGNHVTCNNVGGNISAGNYVKVEGDVMGDTTAGNYVKVDGKRR